MDAGSPAPLGATLTGDGVNFALYSAVAKRVELCLYSEDGRALERMDLPECTDNVWHGFVPGLAAGQRYGYRTHGPFRPAGGLFCNPEKLLIDPYARRLDGEFHWHDSVFGYKPGDSAPHVPKSVVCEPRPRPKRVFTIAWADTIFYELNVRGYTMRHPSVSDAERGKFDGLRNKDVLEYLKSLGITSVELMPVHAFIDEHHLMHHGLRNFWGYNTINFFAPTPRYANADPVAEFRSMVDAIHDAGMEVILDVVYNHTGEADAGGPTLSFRGIDNLRYYRVDPDKPGNYINDTGCGNTINADEPVVQQLILDSLRYWANDMGVDGFRFDLATVLGRHEDGFSAKHPLLLAISRDPALADAKLIAEPWDPGPGGYQLGAFPGRWAEWNDRFRDAARRFWRGDDKQTGELARRLHGSADLFEASGRTPSAGVSFVTTHDGYTLYDLVSYERRHNEANGENNRDGQLGAFPGRWAEWNDRFRDAARRFWRGDDKQTGELARRLHGSADLFEASGRTPSAGVSFVTTHDGYTLYDLVSYERRHNEANGENNRDGHRHNYSCNHGVEGPTDDGRILWRRRQHQLNLLATLLVSRGTPLLLAGDEFGNTQGGNNNAYAQDNEIGWLDWSGIERDPEFTEAVKSLIRLRNELPLLRLDQYVHGTLEKGGRRISIGWINPDGAMRTEEDWSFGHAFGVLLTDEHDGELVAAGALYCNAWHGQLPIELPIIDEPLDWHVEFCSDRRSLEVVEQSLRLPGHSIALLRASVAEPVVLAEAANDA